MKLASLLLLGLFLSSAAYAQTFPPPGMAYFPSADPTGSLGIGYKALLNPGLSGVANTAYGSYALFSNTSASNNATFGFETGYNITTGSNNSAFGSQALVGCVTCAGNVAIGGSALQNNFGNANVAVGYAALFNNTAGTLNVAVGFDAGLDLTSGNGNTAVGAQALQTASTTDSQTAVGYNALHASSGARNVGIGFNALQANTTGIDSVAVGANALPANTTANDNVAVGVNALFTTRSGGFNSALGDNACYMAIGTDNICLGFNSGFNGSFVSPEGISSGTFNIVIGEQANITTGSSNIVIGMSPTGTTPANSHQIDIGDVLFLNNTSTAAPTVSACAGGTVDAHANSKSGTVSVGSGTVTSCTIIFAAAYASWNHCRVTAQNASSAFGYTYTLSAITVTSQSLAGVQFDYDCDGL